MEQSKDFIEREIQKLNLLLAALLNKVSGTNAGDFDVTIQQVNEALKEEFDFSIEEFSELQHQDLVNKLYNLHQMHLEKIAEIFYYVVKNIDETEKENKYTKTELINNTIFLIDYINQYSSTFSIQRTNLKNDLQQWNQKRNMYNS